MPGDALYCPIYYGLGLGARYYQIVSSLNKSGNTASDVRANVGWFISLFGKLVGASGKVVGFEPVPNNYSRLVEHVEINNLLVNTEILNLTAGKEKSIINIHVFDNRTKARSSLLLLNEATSNKKTPVQLVKADAT